MFSEGMVKTSEREHRATEESLSSCAGSQVVKCSAGKWLTTENTELHVHL